MADSWKTIYKEKLEGRDIKVKKYDDDGSYQAITTQKDDDPGTFLRDETSVTHVFPSNTGRKIVIYGKTKDELVQEMVKVGFSEDEAKDFVKRF